MWRSRCAPNRPSRLKHRKKIFANVISKKTKVKMKVHPDRCINLIYPTLETLNLKKIITFEGFLKRIVRKTK